MCCFIAWPAKCKSPVSYEKIMSAINTRFRTRLRACRSFFLTPASRPDTFVAGRAVGGTLPLLTWNQPLRLRTKSKRGENAPTWLRQPAPTDFVRIVRINSPRSAEGLRGFIPRGLLRALCSPTIFTLLLASGELRAFLPVLLLRLIVVVAREGIAWR